MTVGKCYTSNRRKESGKQNWRESRVHHPGLRSQPLSRQESNCRGSEPWLEANREPQKLFTVPLVTSHLKDGERRGRLIQVAAALIGKGTLLGETLLLALDINNEKEPF